MIEEESKDCKRTFLKRNFKAINYSNVAMENGASAAEIDCTMSRYIGSDFSCFLCFFVCLFVFTA